MLLKYNFNLKDVSQSQENQAVVDEAIDKAEQAAAEINELTLKKGSVHDDEEPKQKFALALAYPGRYHIQLGFISPHQYAKGLFAPNIDLSISQNTPRQEQTHWLGDIDAAFGFYELSKEINYFGHGRYVIDGAIFDQSANPIYLIVEAFDTNHHWVHYNLELKDANY